MGNNLSVVVEHYAHKSIYQPPPVNYKRESCQFTRTKCGDSIAMRLYSVSTDVQVRWLSETSAAASPYDLLVLSHGNGTDIGHMHRFCEHLSSKLRVDVVVYDYPGYGHSTGEQVCEKTMLAAADAVFTACQDHGYKAERMCVVGHSLGSVPALHLAAQTRWDVAGVLLLAPLASGSRVFLQNSRYTPKWVLGHLDCLLLDNTQRVARVRCPVAIVHGTNDFVVTVEHTECLKARIAETSRYPTLFLATGHNELVDASGRDLLKITEYIRKFYAKILPQHEENKECNDLLLLLD